MAAIRRESSQTQVRDQHEHTISNLAYADDLAAMTNNIADMKVQAQKVQAFVTLSGMPVNCKKCAITGMVYKQSL